MSLENSTPSEKPLSARERAQKRSLEINAGAKEERTQYVREREKEVHEEFENLMRNFSPEQLEDEMKRVFELNPSNREQALLDLRRYEQEAEGGATNAIMMVAMLKRLIAGETLCMNDCDLLIGAAQKDPNLIETDDMTLFDACSDMFDYIIKKQYVMRHPSQTSAKNAS